MTLSARLPHDDTDATLMRFDGVRGQRYTEIFLIAPAQTGELIGSIYNTIGLNDPDDSGDTCPQPLLVPDRLLGRGPEPHRELRQPVLGR